MEKMQKTMEWSQLTRWPHIVGADGGNVPYYGHDRGLGSANLTLPPRPKGHDVFVIPTALPWQREEKHEGQNAPVYVRMHSGKMDATPHHVRGRGAAAAIAVRSRVEPRLVDAAPLQRALSISPSA